jgi:hypothetical protein
MIRRQHLPATISLAIVCVAALGACSSDKQATPQITLDSSISHGTHSTTECSQTGEWVAIGSFGNPALGRKDPNDPNSPLVAPVLPVKDGDAFDQGTASVSCSVVENGDGFDVAAEGELSGATGGAMTLQGHVLRGVDSPNVTVSLSRKGETYTGSTCTVTFNTQAGHGIAAGRIWALVDCPDANAPSEQKVCATHAELRFENCGQ